MIVSHRSTRSKTDAILASAPDDELWRMLSGFQATEVAGGHTHAQMLRCTGVAAPINPGSTAQPNVRARSTRRIRHPAWAE